MNEAEHSVEHPPVQGSHVEGGVVEHPDAKDFGSAAALPADPTWFKHAVFYEVLVRAFFDASADGSGDLRGLIDRLDYLQWLGIDCIWLPPFYDSPLRDGGYDIRDFYKVPPEFGTVDDFVALVDAAHRRGIRIITDLVMNHTSESHPGFRSPAATQTDRTVTITCGATPASATPTPGSSSSTPKSRTGHSILSADSSTGTDSSPTNRI